jgi:hypothetical protein
VPLFTAVIENLVAGDFRQIPWSITNVPTGGAVSKGWMTVKANEADLDVNAIFQKLITTVLDTSEGHITSDGAGTGVATGFFNLLEAETIQLEPQTPYYYDLQFQFTMGDLTTRISTPEKGTVTTIKGITDAVS